MRRGRVLAVVVAVVVSIVSCSGGEDEVFMSIDAGTSAFAAAGNTAMFTVGDLEHGAVFISVSPETSAWTGSPTDVVEAFGDDTLNAVVMSPHTGDAVALALSQPSYAADSGELTFEAIPLDDLRDSAAFGHFGDELVAPDTGSWGAVTVFIDPTTNIKPPGVYVAEPTNACLLAIDNQTSDVVLEIVQLVPEGDDWVNANPGKAIGPGMTTIQVDVNQLYLLDN